MNPQGTLVVTDVYSEKGDHLALIHIKDGRMEKLVNTPRTHPRNHKQTHTHPMWSPDGSMVMYDSDESGVCQIYIVDREREESGKIDLYCLGANFNFAIWMPLRLGSRAAI